MLQRNQQQISLSLCAVGSWAVCAVFSLLFSLPREGPPIVFLSTGMQSPLEAYDPSDLGH